MSPWLEHSHASHSVANPRPLLPNCPCPQALWGEVLYSGGEKVLSQTHQLSNLG